MTIYNTVPFLINCMNRMIVKLKQMQLRVECFAAVKSNVLFLKPLRNSINILRTKRENHKCINNIKYGVKYWEIYYIM